MVCLKHAELLFIKEPIARWLWQYLFPAQFTLGVLGNCLNLWVLASDEVSNVASDLLAAVSFCDLAFLLAMVPHALSSFESLAVNYTFRSYYIKTRQHIAAVANWMSAAAIWYPSHFLIQIPRLILAVSIERFLIIRQPLRSKLYWQRGRMVLVLSSIFFATGILTLYHHFEYDCDISYFCNGTQIYGDCYYAGEIHWRTYLRKEQIRPSEGKMAYLKASTIFNVFLVVFLPIVVVIILNILMIRELHNSNKELLEMDAARESLVRNQHKSRRRVTITVIAIGLCFSLTQGPSSVMVIMEQFKFSSHFGETFYSVFSITNSLVVTGKTINFILFCLSSEHFRRRCFVIVLRKFPQLQGTRLCQRFGVTVDYNRTTSLDQRGSSLRTLRSRRDSAQRDSALLTDGRRDRERLNSQRSCELQESLS